MSVRAVLGTWRNRVRRAASQPAILMYHRIAQPPVDPWGLAVRPEHFEQHLAVLRRSRQPMRMSDFFDRLTRGTLPGNAVAVTFDDGYVDNLREAKPRLAAHDVPATVFVTTGPVGQRTEYWWDELARGILMRDHALDDELSIDGEPCRLVFPDLAGGRHGGPWRAWEQPRTERETAYLAVWRRLRTATHHERVAVMNRLRDVLGTPPPDPSDLPLTSAEVADLANDGLIEIGAHTVTHPVLPALDPGERRREIRESKLDCERLTGRAATGFAYPHGALDADSCAAVQESGFAWACSTHSAVVSDRDYDRYALPRLCVLDWDAHAFERALQTVAA
ncbi:MAG: polysaccharide deacetylase family protein [Vicinamibacterales bacterium]